MPLTKFRSDMRRWLVRTTPLTPWEIRFLNSFRDGDKLTERQQMTLARLVARAQRAERGSDGTPPQG